MPKNTDHFPVNVCYLPKLLENSNFPAFLRKTPLKLTTALG